MLRRLKIQNLVLVERAEIAFGPGLNILTGETGAGKSAILSAIRLIAGGRAELQLIGQRGDSAIVEASLETYSLPADLEPPPPGEPLLIRREIHRNGKSRCFAEDQQVSLSLLRQIVGSSIELVDQSSAQSLCSLEEQRKTLDAFAGLLDDALELAASYTEEQTEEKRYGELIAAEERRSRDLAWVQDDLASIEEVNWKAEEEETLGKEHQILIHSSELHEKVGSVANGLGEGNLKRAAAALEASSRFDATLAPHAAALKSCSLEIDEVRRFLDTYLGRLESDPGRLAAIEKRIASIEQIKRKFGKTVAEVEEKKRDLLSKFERLTHLDEERSGLERTLKQLQEKNRVLAAKITARRRETASIFSVEVLRELQSLNLPRAKFEITTAEKPLCSYGCDEIRFLFSANPGHPPIPLEECASGGELSRLLLAIKTVLSQKISASCLIFDEIDSNVGGQTAAVLGEKLKALAASKQVICVTHFVQVAKCALRHFVVAKSEQNGKAVTQIEELENGLRETEYRRMLGT